MTDEVLIDILTTVKQIEKNQEQTFGVGTAFAAAIAGALTFVIALSLNNALQLSFAQIPVGSNAILGAWIYAFLALLLGLTGLYLVYRYLQPVLKKKLDPL